MNIDWLQLPKELKKFRYEVIEAEKNVTASLEPSVSALSMTMG